MTWLEVRLTVSGELAEPVAEVLSRHCQGGVVITAAADYSAAAPGDLIVAGYLANDEQQAALKQQIREGLWHLSQIQPLPEPTFQYIEQVNWAETWKQHYKPVEVGRRLLIKPPWIDSTSDRITISIEPGMAFGTGTHPSTVLSLELIEHHLQPGATFADLGCGSGILSIAAVKLGADRALAYDIDSESVAASRQNAKANEVLDKVSVTLGSLDELAQDIQAGMKPDLMAANILAPVLRQLLEDGLSEWMPPRSTLVMAGILEDQYSELRELAAGLGLEELERIQSEDWVAVALKKTRPN